MRCWLAALLLGWSALTGAETWHFGLIGDVPYSDRERAELPLMLSVIADSQVDFIAHIGDFKHGSARCDDGVFEDRHRLFNNSRVPFIFVPGDNEWSDCDRLSNGAYDPLERLAKLRRLFWPDAFSLGMQKLPLERQPGSYVEHARFRLGPVLFVTFNLPGGNNNFGMTGEASAEFQARNPIVLAWLADSFAVARRDRLAGIVLLFQANPGFRHFSQGLAHRGYRSFLENLQRETMNFSGQVVVVHGDSHMSRIDHPLRDGHGKPLANFTRVETFGYPLMGWTRGSIDTDSPELFRFATHPWPRRGY
ncbi:MAG TPA: metallophosphoesterase [Azonexus sp.]|nr:metallophosphoesterase [Azonexus sp.]